MQSKKETKDKRVGMSVACIPEGKRSSFIRWANKWGMFNTRGDYKWYEFSPLESHQKASRSMREMWEEYLKEKSNSNGETEKLVKHINKYISPVYKLFIHKLEDEFINVSENTSNSNKAISLEKKKEIYIDWYYNEFNEDKLREDCRRMEIIDRDMDVILSAEFRDISQRIISALNNF